MTDEIREQPVSLSFARPRLASEPSPPDLHALAERMEAAAQRMEAAAERQEQAATAIEERAREIKETAAPLVERLSDPESGGKKDDGATR